LANARGGYHLDEPVCWKIQTETELYPSPSENVMYTRSMIKLDCEMWDASLERSSAGEDSPMLYIRNSRRDPYQQRLIGSWADAQASQIQHTFPYGNPDYFTFRVPLQTALIMDK
jgi:hypothetical protein